MSGEMTPPQRSIRWSFTTTGCLVKAQSATKTSIHSTVGIKIKTIRLKTIMFYTRTRLLWVVFVICYCAFRVEITTIYLTCLYLQDLQYSAKNTPAVMTELQECKSISQAKPFSCMIIKMHENHPKQPRMCSWQNYS